MDKATPFTSRFVQVSDGTHLCLHEIGVGAGPPVLFLHGFPDCKEAFVPMMEDMAESWRCIGFDSRGHGASDLPTRLDAYQIDRLVQDIADVCDALDLPRVNLVAHDWGGLVAYEFAARYPERMEAMAIFNAPHPFSLQKAMVTDIEQHNRSAYVRRFRSEGFAEKLQSLSSQEQWALFFGNQNEIIERDHRAALLKSWRRPGAWKAMLSWYRASHLDPDTARAAALPPAPILTPTLLLWGEKDPLFAPSSLEDFQMLCPHGRILIHKEGGHSLFRSHPQWALQAVLEHLAASNGG
jgi:epoxide hydrolase 4